MVDDETEVTFPPPYWDDPRWGLGDRNVGTLLPEFYPDGLPTESGVSAWWTEVRRRDLGNAVRRGGTPYLRVIETPIDGITFHVHPGDHVHDSDPFARALSALGPLGFTLLRSQRPLLDVQWETAAVVAGRYEGLVAEMKAAREARVPHPEANYVAETRFIFWDALGQLLAVSEQLATLFLAVSEWRGHRSDLGLAILSGDALPYKVFQSSAFTSSKWWSRNLRFQPASPTGARLTDALRSLWTEINSESFDFVLRGANDLAGLWNRELHRVAVRHKHSFTIVSASYGVGWGRNESDADLLAEIYRAGGLLIADLKDDAPVQLTVEITIGGMEVVLGSLYHAIGITQLLVNRLLDEAETPRSKLPLMHFVTNDRGTAEEREALLRALLGEDEAYVDDVVRSERAKSDQKASIRRAGQFVRDDSPRTGTPA